MSKQWTKLNYAVHPGEILKDYLNDLGFTQIEFAKKVGINKTIINEIINGKRPITIKTAIKFENVFSFDAHFWYNLQMIYDEAVERLKLKSAAQGGVVSVLLYNINEIDYTMERTNDTTIKYMDIALAA